MSDRVVVRRRAAQLARHYRDEENLTIAEIARRLGRAEATVKAYLYDPSDDNKRPTDSPQDRTSGRSLVMHGRRFVSPSSAVAATARGRRSRLTDSSACGSLERRYRGPRYCPSFVIAVVSRRPRR